MKQAARKVSHATMEKATDDERAVAARRTADLESQAASQHPTETGTPISSHSRYHCYR